MYEEAFNSLRSAAAALFAVSSRNHSVRFLLLSTPAITPWTVVALARYREPTCQLHYATARIISNTTYSELREIAAAFPPSFDLPPHHDTPPPTI